MLDRDARHGGEGGRRRSTSGARRSPATSPIRRRWRAAFDEVVDAFGGVDIVVSNAGAAWQGKIGERRRRGAAQIVRAQFLRASERGAERGAHHAGAGHGRLPAVQHSKQAVNPGKDFGPYGLPKAATLFLMRQYALDHGKRWHPRQRRQRRPHPHGPADQRDGRGALEGARRVASRDYMSGNLLGREVYAPTKSPKPSSISRMPRRRPPASSPSTAATSKRACGSVRLYRRILTPAGFTPI